MVDGKNTSLAELGYNNGKRAQVTLLQLLVISDLMTDLLSFQTSSGFIEQVDKLSMVIT